MPAPALTLVVPSHARPERLRRLLGALAAQTLGRESWEAVIVHDYSDADTREIVEGDPLFEEGTLRQIRIAPGTGSPARQRNLGWRAAQAPLVAFTDDDCRPDPGWLEALLAASRRHPGAIVQGRTLPDPLDAAAWRGAHVRSMAVEPPGPLAQTCNILYPVAVLEGCGGFDEAFPGAAGEDVDLALRARGRGTPYVGVPEALVHHAVERHSLAQMIRLNLKWRDIALLVKRHPRLRRGYPLGVFWRVSHFRLALAALGAASGRRRPVLALLAAPYVRDALNAHGSRPRGRLLSALHLPSRVVVDAADVGGMVWGSIKHHTLVL